MTFIQLCAEVQEIFEIPSFKIGFFKENSTQKVILVNDSPIENIILCKQFRKDSADPL